MSFFWSIYERVSDIVGPMGALAVFAMLLGVALYLVLGSARPST
jgi:hypothetical protein